MRHSREQSKPVNLLLESSEPVCGTKMSKSEEASKLMEQVHQQPPQDSDYGYNQPSVFIEENLSRSYTQSKV